MPTIKDYPVSAEGATELLLPRKLFHGKAISVHHRSHIKWSTILTGYKVAMSLISDPGHNNAGTHSSQQKKYGPKCTPNAYFGWRCCEAVIILCIHTI